MRRIVQLAAVTAFVASSGVASSASVQPDAGLAGKVMRGPTSPVCRADRACDGPFKGTLVFTPVSPAAGLAPVRAQSQADGDYRVTLAPARYRVTTGLRSRFGGLVRPALVTVPAGAVRRVNFVVDTGIR